MSHRIELIYDEDCPNAELARQRLREALAASGCTVAPTEWLRTALDTPDVLQGWGSPTILIDGRDVAGQQPSESPTCRVYPRPGGGFDRAPSVDQIVAALDAIRPTRSPRRIRALLPVAPGVAVSFLPVVSCPACWPAYAGVLSSLGVPFLSNERIVLPVVVGLMLVSVVALAWRARERRGFAPALLGLVGAGIVVGGRAGAGSILVACTGGMLLLAASIWNVWPVRRVAAENCGSSGSCSPRDGGTPS